MSMICAETRRPRGRRDNPPSSIVCLRRLNVVLRLGNPRVVDRHRRWAGKTHTSTSPDSLDCLKARGELAAPLRFVLHCSRAGCAGLLRVLLRFKLSAADFSRPAMIEPAAEVALPPAMRSPSFPYPHVTPPLCFRSRRPQCDRQFRRRSSAQSSIGLRSNRGRFHISTDTIQT
jgi:hypothetical protein